MKIKAKIITNQNFSPFGKVVTGVSGYPTSQAADYKFWSDIMSYQIEGETEVGICSVYRQDETKINGMERHIYTPEVLIPIDSSFVIPLLKDKEKPEMAEAFTVHTGQAIAISEKIWHGACIPVDKNECSYFVIFKKGTPFKDVEKTNLPEINIEL